MAFYEKKTARPAALVLEKDDCAFAVVLLYRPSVAMRAYIFTRQVFEYGFDVLAVSRVDAASSHQWQQHQDDEKTFHGFGFQTE